MITFINLSRLIRDVTYFYFYVQLSASNMIKSPSLAVLPFDTNLDPLMPLGLEDVRTGQCYVLIFLSRCCLYLQIYLWRLHYSVQYIIALSSR
jgi:hypothetical protein